LERAGRVARRVLAPQIVDQPIRRHRSSPVDQEIEQQRAHLGVGHGDRLARVRPDDQRPEHLEVHAATVASATDTRRESVAAFRSIEL
jgi:hypothetical protein